MQETSALEKNYKQYIPTFLLATGIMYLSLASGSGLPKTHIHFEHMDKLVHMVMYGTLAIGFSWDMQRSHVQHTKLLVLALILPAAYGGLLELIQPFFPPRTAEWLDFVADFNGAWIGTIIFDILCRKIHS